MIKLLLIASLSLVTFTSAALAAETTTCRAADHTVLITNPGFYIESPGRVRVRNNGFFGGTFIDDQAQIVQADRGGEKLLVPGTEIAAIYAEKYAAWDEFHKASVEVIKSANTFGLIHYDGAVLTVVLEVPSENIVLRFRDDRNDGIEEACSFSSPGNWLGL